jgi:hypothetical protein
MAVQLAKARAGNTATPHRLAGTTTPPTAAAILQYATRSVEPEHKVINRQLFITLGDM